MVCAVARALCVVTVATASAGAQLVRPVAVARGAVAAVGANRGEVAPSAAAVGPGGAGVVVWADRRFRGATAAFRTPVPDLARFGMAGRVVSLRVAAAERWEGCEGANFTGRCETFRGADPDLADRNWGHRLRSLRPVREGVGSGAAGGAAAGVVAAAPGEGGPLFRAYGHSVYHGSPETFTGATPRARLGIVGSVRVRGRWEVCGAPDYRGACAVLDGDVPALGHALGLLTIRSLRPR